MKSFARIVPSSAFALFAGLAINTMATTGSAGAAPYNGEQDAQIKSLILKQGANDNPLVKVAEWCGADSFKDEYGKCRPYGYDAPPPNPHDACPPNRHFVHWVYHSGGRCVPNY